MILSPWRSHQTTLLGNTAYVNQRSQMPIPQSDLLTTYRPPGTMKASIRSMDLSDPSNGSWIILVAVGCSSARGCFFPRVAQSLIHLRGAIAACSSSSSLILTVGKLDRKRALSRHMAGFDLDYTFFVISLRVTTRSLTANQPSVSIESKYFVRNTERQKVSNFYQSQNRGHVEQLQYLRKSIKTIVKPEFQAVNKNILSGWSS